MKILAATEDWAIGADEVQWILYESRVGSLPWRSIAFVRSTREVLECRMREKGVGSTSRAFLLSRLPDTFDEWKTLQDALERQEMTPQRPPEDNT